MIRPYIGIPKADFEEEEMLLISIVEREHFRT